jgi:gamma-carbonic anhydrase
MMEFDIFERFMTSPTRSPANPVVQFFTRHRPIMTFYEKEPFVTNDTFIAPSASVIGEVTNWDESRHGITIGFSSNIQDGSVVTTLGEKGTLETGFPPITHVGHYVSVGAGSVLTSCRIDDLVIIGDKCTIMEGSLVESHVILEPGTVVPAYARIPSGQKWGGNPAKYIADLTIDERESIPKKAEKIYEQAYEHLVEFLPVGNSYLHLEDLEKKGVAKQG